jgi:hypothetical protein
VLFACGATNLAAKRAGLSRRKPQMDTDGHR